VRIWDMKPLYLVHLRLYIQCASSWLTYASLAVTLKESPDLFSSLG
jgi:hypothetical protein